jgi:UDP-N-acetylmuramoyl-tripeptide--D-alanyl-D-alanine ligase
MNSNELYQIYKECGYQVCTDTRKIISKSLFFALSGDNFNGNKFASEALEKGCLYAICDDKNISGENIIHVDNVLNSLQVLANHHRCKFDIPILGITGSNGKTTTKELLASVLEKDFNLLFTKGNLNNHIGVPLTLLQLRGNHEFAIVEMGANKEGDIHELCQIASPTYGLITNIGVAHIEGFGSKEGVVKAKSEMYRYIINKNGVLFVNKNEPYLLPLTQNYSNCIEYGNGTNLFFNLNTDESKLKLTIDGKFIKTNLFGSYNANNVLTAYAVAKQFGINTGDIIKSLEEYSPNNNRSQIKISKRGNQLILDAYNANPSSMNLAIDEFLNKNGNKLCILGDMNELGVVSKEEHLNVIKKIISSGIKAIFVGPEFIKYTDSNHTVFERVEALIESSELKFITNYKVLIKGSRGVQLEKLESYL